MRWLRRGDAVIRARCKCGSFCRVGDTRCLPCAVAPTWQERFWSYVEKTSGCWLWRAALNYEGYGLFNTQGVMPTKMAHRISYILANGPLPVELHIDHLCKTPACVKPGHLEAVTPAENNRRSNSRSAVNLRKTHCVHGHAFDNENTAIIRRSNGKVNRACRACHRDREKRRYYR